MSSQELEKTFSSSRILTARFKREGKICRRLLTSFFKREIRKLQVVVRVKETAKKCTKMGDTDAKLLFYLLNLLGFFMFSLHLRNSPISLYSLISLLFFFSSNGARGGGGGGVGSFV